MTLFELQTHLMATDFYHRLLSTKEFFRVNSIIWSYQIPMSIFKANICDQKVKKSSANHKLSKPILSFSFANNLFGADFISPQRMLTHYSVFAQGSIISSFAIDNWYKAAYNNSRYRILIRFLCVLCSRNWIYVF